MTAFTFAHRVRRLDLDAFVQTEVDGELVFMNVGEGSFHSLRHAGMRAWRLIGDGGGTTVGALVKALCEEFEVDEETCLRDVSVLLEEMAGAGVVAVEGGTAPP